MKTIWKSALRMDDVQTVRLPAGAKLLTVQMQHGYIPTLWAAVDPAAPLVDRVIAIYATGQTIPDNPGKHLATVQDHSLSVPMVWHVFEIDEPADGLEMALTGNDNPASGKGAKHKEAATWATV